MLANLPEEPLSKLLGRFNYPAAEEVGIRIEEIGSDREQPPECRRLLSKDRKRQWVASISVISDPLRRVLTS